MERKNSIRVCFTPILSMCEQGFHNTRTLLLQKALLWGQGSLLIAYIMLSFRQLIVSLSLFVQSHPLRKQHYADHSWKPWCRVMFMSPTLYIVSDVHTNVTNNNPTYNLNTKTKSRHTHSCVKIVCKYCFTLKMRDDES